MADTQDAGAQPGERVVIKKYANRRLYNTASSSYVTLEHLADMVKKGVDFVVYDAKTNEDITRSVLTQIIFEQENKEGGQNLLPINFLRQLIRFYGDSVERMVPSYLQVSLETLAKEQDRFRKQFTGVPGGKRPDGKPGADKGPAPEAKAGDTNEISELKTQLANMQQKIDKLTQDRD